MSVPGIALMEAAENVLLWRVPSRAKFVSLMTEARREIVAAQTGDIVEACRLHEEIENRAPIAWRAREGGTDGR